MEADAPTAEQAALQKTRAEAEKIQIQVMHLQDCERRSMANIQRLEEQKVRRSMVDIQRVGGAEGGLACGVDDEDGGAEGGVACWVDEEESWRSRRWGCLLGGRRRRRSRRWGCMLGGRRRELEEQKVGSHVGWTKNRVGGAEGGVACWVDEEDGGCGIACWVEEDLDSGPAVLETLPLTLWVVVEPLINN